MARGARNMIVVGFVVGFVVAWFVFFGTVGGTDDPA